MWLNIYITESNYESKLVMSQYFLFYFTDFFLSWPCSCGCRAKAEVDRHDTFQPEPITFQLRLDRSLLQVSKVFSIAARSSLTDVTSNCSSGISQQLRLNKCLWLNVVNNFTIGHSGQQHESSMYFWNGLHDLFIICRFLPAVWWKTQTSCWFLLFVFISFLAASDWITLQDTSAWDRGGSR